MFETAACTLQLYLYTPQTAIPNGGT